MNSLVVIHFLLFVIIVNYCETLTKRDVNSEPETNGELRGRVPPITFALESVLQYILRNDRQKCVLKLVCTVGANVTQYGTYGDVIASYFGYTYNPYDFSVVEIPHILDIYGRPSNVLPTIPDQSGPSVSDETVVNDGITKESDPELFARESLMEARSGFPAVNVFNRAFVMGVKEGLEPCVRFFPNCTMDVDLLIRFASNMFQRPLNDATR